MALFQIPESNSTHLNLTVYDSAPHLSCYVDQNEPIKRMNHVLYGIIFPLMIFIGIVGNILNVLVLTRSTLTGVCYFYMRFKVSTDLVGLLFLLPSSLKYLREDHTWRLYSSAFFYAHVQLYVINVFFGVGILSMVAMTFERYLRIRYPLKYRISSNLGAKTSYKIATALTLSAFLLYLPYAFSNYVVPIAHPSGFKKYAYCTNAAVTDTSAWRAYIWFKQSIFKFIPVILIASMNAVIWTRYSDFLARKRRLKGATTPLHEPDKHLEETRLKRMLTSLSVLFLISMTPSAILSGMIYNDDVRNTVGFEIFRATANYLELCFYSFSFYIFCLSSPQFRRLFSTVIRIATGSNNVVHPSQQQHDDDGGKDLRREQFTDALEMSTKIQNGRQILRQQHRSNPSADVASGKNGCANAVFYIDVDDKIVK